MNLLFPAMSNMRRAALLIPANLYICTWDGQLGVCSCYLLGSVTYWNWFHWYVILWIRRWYLVTISWWGSVVKSCELGLVDSCKPAAEQINIKMLNSEWIQIQCNCTMSNMSDRMLLKPPINNVMCNSKFLNNTTLWFNPSNYNKLWFKLQ